MTENNIKVLGVGWLALGTIAPVIAGHPPARQGASGEWNPHSPLYTQYR